MNIPRLVPLCVCLALTVALVRGQDAAMTYLLDVAAGQLPTDTGSDKKTYSSAEHPDLGKCLKVEFDPGDSFGDRARVKNWKPFAAISFDAINPSKEEFKFNLNVIHRRSTNFQTRVVMPFTLKPGKNSIRIGMDEMVNVNGSAPDLSSITKWYINVEDRKGPTIFFSGIALEGGEAARPAAPAVGGGLPANVAYHIKGTIGDLKVDLTITPIPLKTQPTTPTSGAKVSGDPARLARIKAATMPKFDKPVMFDTPEADAIVSALEVFPADNPWNLVVSDWPLHPNSKNIIGSIGPQKPFRYNPDMGYILVPPGQKKVDVKLIQYSAESDKGPFPLPDNTPIEGWPVGYKKGGKQIALEVVQRSNEAGDRHAMVVDPVNRMLYEFFVMRRTDGGWQCEQSSTFDLKSNKLRPDGWTSADAAGLPIFPAVARYDELKRGIVEHAMRVTVVKTRREYVYPATHFASRLTDENLPRMGERIRLRQDFDIAGFSPEVTAILKGLKKYGMFVADNGIDWAISVAPDPRIPNLSEELRKLKGSDFEVVTPPPGYKPAQ